MGYTTINIKKNSITAFGVQFQKLDGSKEIAIKDLLTVANPQTGFNLTGADSLQVWVSAENKFKYYYNRRNVGWVENNKTTITADTVKEGDGIYFRRTGSASGDTTITVAGQVNVSDPNFPITVKKNSITFLCNPWPVEFPINDFATMTAAPQSGFNLTGADSVQVWDPAGSKYTFYYNRRNVGYVENNKTTKTTDTILPGAAVMFRRTGSSSGDTTVTFTKPAGL